MNTKHKKTKSTSFDSLLGEMMQSQSFREGYHEELARIDIAHQLKLIRLKKKLTQEDLAVKTMMPRSVIARTESGEHSITLATLARIAGALDKKIRLV